MDLVNAITVVIIAVKEDATEDAKKFNTLIIKP